MDTGSEESASDSHKDGDGGVETGTIADRDSRVIIPPQNKGNLEEKHSLFGRMERDECIVPL
jgi:hypothetical protein